MKFNPRSDFALNKRCKDEIIYLSAVGAFIRLNAGNCPEFERWKAWSDHDYYMQDFEEVNTTRQNISIHGLPETDLVDSASPEKIVIERDETKSGHIQTTELTMEYGEQVMDRLLTPAQKTRFTLRHRDNMPYRAIAAAEGGVKPMAIQKSVKQAEKKLKNFMDVMSNQTLQQHNM